MLTNDEVESSGPLACLPIGQPTLRHKIKLGVLNALDQRSPRSRRGNGLLPGPPPRARRRTDTFFTDDAITLLHDTARGYPRVVNNLAVQALLSA
ncbi:hypothetical protein ABT278_34345 [Streptomyces sp. NPDC001228]|uniref:hypothetical protein n=1 Tax=Streptomyces sp. NPDC001228 TaxID=3154381 RepID=UPI00331743EB